MDDYGAIKIACSSMEQFSAAFSAAYQALPPEVQMRLREIMKGYVAQYGIRDAYQRINGRTVFQILVEYRPVELRPVASGEIDGVRYELHEPKPSAATDGERSDNG